MPAPIRKLADRYLYEPVHVKVESATLTVETIDQVIVEVEPNGKLDVLCALLERDRPAAAIVFRRRKMTVDELVAPAGRPRLRRRAAARRHDPGPPRLA